MRKCCCHFGQFRKWPFGSCLQDPAFVGQAKGTAVAINQAQAKAVLKFAHMTRERGFGPPCRDGCRSKAAVAGNKVDISQGRDIESAFHF